MIINNLITSKNKREAMQRLQKSKAKVTNRYKHSTGAKILTMDEVNKMLDSKLLGESLSQEIINERDEERL